MNAVEIAKRYLELRAKFKLTAKEIMEVNHIRCDECVHVLCEAVVETAQLLEKFMGCELKEVEAYDWFEKHAGET